MGLDYSRALLRSGGRAVRQRGYGGRWAQPLWRCGSQPNDVQRSQRAHERGAGSRGSIGGIGDGGETTDDLQSPLGSSDADISPDMSTVTNSDGSTETFELSSDDMRADTQEVRQDELDMRQNERPQEPQEPSNTSNLPHYSHGNNGHSGDVSPTVQQTAETNAQDQAQITASNQVQFGPNTGSPTMGSVIVEGEINGQPIQSIQTGLKGTNDRGLDTHSEVQGVGWTTSRVLSNYAKRATVWNVK